MTRDLTAERPGSLPDTIQHRAHEWQNLEGAIYAAFLGAVRTLDATDRFAGQRLLDGLAVVANRQTAASKGAVMGVPWQGPHRELGHVVELAIPDDSKRAAFVDQMARRGYPLHLGAAQA